MILHEDEELSVSPEPTSSRTLSIRKSTLYTVPEHTHEEDEDVSPTQASDSLNTRVDTLEINFSVLIKRVEGLKRMLDDVRGDICGLGGTLDGMERSYGALQVAKR
ncbi:hypothetical protein B0H16DRAFT_1716810 [Mycena metata]|uniref:Uncharacterized protein n=1 Tax=Mycena metata TaxID=1033252 RepID=A0AAD7JNP6_9AGAR|nr:hypothetical protein B0H16DRAFT_1716810 [Mycena metata]